MLLVVLAACATGDGSPDGTTAQGRPSHSYNSKVSPVTIGLGRGSVMQEHFDPCVRSVLDYTGLYGIVDTLPTVTSDSVFIDTILRLAGMRLIRSGHGNWADGPRMINLTFASERCTCQVSKVYFFHERHPDGSWDTRVVERVACNVPDTLIPWWSDDDHIRAHEVSSRHRAVLGASDSCGCFYCFAVFPPREITQWTDVDANGIGQTAICPHCGIDAVIGSASGYPITTGFLGRMNRHWL